MNASDTLQQPTNNEYFIKNQEIEQPELVIGNEIHILEETELKDESTEIAGNIDGSAADVEAKDVADARNVNSTLENIPKDLKSAKDSKIEDETMEEIVDAGDVVNSLENDKDFTENGNSPEDLINAGNAAEILANNQDISEKERRNTMIIAQKVLRQLHFTLPTRKSTLDVKKFIFKQEPKPKVKYERIEYESDSEEVEIEIINKKPNIHERNKELFKQSIEQRNQRIKQEEEEKKLLKEQLLMKRKLRKQKRMLAASAETVEESPENLKISQEDDAVKNDGSSVIENIDQSSQMDGDLMNLLSGKFGTQSQLLDYKSTGENEIDSQLDDLKEDPSQLNTIQTPTMITDEKTVSLNNNNEVDESQTNENIIKAADSDSELSSSSSEESSNELDVQNFIFDDEEDNSGASEESDGAESNQESEPDEPIRLQDYKIPWHELQQQQQVHNDEEILVKPVIQSYVEQEAEVSEDEFKNEGGLDIDYDPTMTSADIKMLDDGNVKERKTKLLQLHNEQTFAEDQENIDALINDVTSGALRKRKARGESSIGLFYDSDEENEMILRKLRAEMGLLPQKHQGDMDGGLKGLALDPKTRAFAKCFVDEEMKAFSSDEEQPNKENAATQKDGETACEVETKKMSKSKFKKWVELGTVYQSDYQFDEEILPAVEQPKTVAFPNIDQILQKLEVCNQPLSISSKFTNITKTSNVCKKFQELGERSSRLLEKKSFLVGDKDLSQVTAQTKDHNSSRVKGFAISSKNEQLIENRVERGRDRLEKRLNKIKKSRSDMFEKVYK